MSLLDISNGALTLIGASQISSLTVTSTNKGPAVDRCNQHVVKSVKEVLGEFPWSHAVEWAEPALLAETPAFHYLYAYQLPVNVISIHDARQEESLNSKKVNFNLVKGKKIYTNASPLYVRYVTYTESDLLLAHPLFIEACSWKLASKICVPLSKSDKLPSMIEGYRGALDSAKFADAKNNNEQQPDENLTNSILVARGFPSTEDLE